MFIPLSPIQMLSLAGMASKAAGGAQDAAMTLKRIEEQNKELLKHIEKQNLEIRRLNMLNKGQQIAERKGLTRYEAHERRLKAREAERKAKNHRLKIKAKRKEMEERKRQAEKKRKSPTKKS
ncbi:MAG: hypothetical protein IH623_28865 [Verrucomicrobia bacterium]|nr:hypothetical protein [Verrucomicrobiota bacterium]